MFASICRRRFVLRLSQILATGGAHSFPSNPSAAFLSHGYSAALAGARSSEPCPATVSYLVSCGLSPAAAAARNVRIRDTDRADAVRSLFREYGFSEAEITRTVRKYPLLLNYDADRIIRPKLDFFLSLGFRPRMVAEDPNMLARSLNNQLVPCIEFLRGILRTDDDLRHAVSRAPRALSADLDKNMRPAVEAFRGHGLSTESIAKLLRIHLGVLLLSPDRIRGIFEDLKALGLCVTDTSFLYGIGVMTHLRKETWLRKVALYRSFGVSEGEFRMAFKIQPTMVCCSDETIKKKLRFFLDELKLELSDVMGQPVIMGYSLERTIIPRCAVLSVLMRERKIEPDIKLINALLGSTKRFSKKYVLRYAQGVPDVVKAYEGKIKFEGFRDRDVLVPLKQ